MTREENLDWLYRLKSEIFVYMPIEWLIPMVDALDMAIEASSVEPCEDAVSRKEMISQLEYCLANFTDYKEALEYTLRKVKNVRSVKVEPQKANWVGIDDYPHELYECNHCGYQHITDDISVFEYCPHCGYKMG